MKNEKTMKISSSFWRFPGSKWESATLSPNFHFFFHLQLHFFHFPSFLMVFHCFSLFFMAFLDFRCHGQGKWKKNDKKRKRWKKNEKNENFLVFEDFLVRSENLQLWVQIFIFFICNFIFFHFPLFLMVFHCFSLFFMAFLDFRCHRQGKWKKNDKKMKKMKKMKISSFEDFLVRSENLQLWVQIFIFSSFATSFFFHFPLFLMVFHCFSLFFMVFLDFRCHGKGKWKKMIKQWSLKWKKMKFEMKKWCLKWKKLKFGETKNEKKMKKNEK